MPCLSFYALLFLCAEGAGIRTTVFNATNIEVNRAYTPYYLYTPDPFTVSLIPECPNGQGGGQTHIFLRNDPLVNRFNFGNLSKCLVRGDQSQ